MTNTTRTTETMAVHPALSATPVEATVVAIDFGLADDKGRKLGGRIEIFAHVAFGTTAAGFAAYWSATRNGKAFGTGTSTIFASSASACETAAMSKLKNTRERYAKKFAR